MTTSTGQVGFILPKDDRERETEMRVRERQRVRETEGETEIETERHRQTDIIYNLCSHIDHFSN